MKIKGVSQTHIPVKDTTEDIWYDRHTRCWVRQLKDANGNQIGDAEYTHEKPKKGRTEQ